MSLHDAFIAAALLQSTVTNVTVLTSGTDLNTVTKAGMYRSNSSTVTGALVNVPVLVGNNGFAMEVFAAAVYPMVVQRITWGGYNTLAPNCLIRCGRPADGVITWGAWHQFALTAVEETAAASLAALTVDETETVTA